MVHLDEARLQSPELSGSPVTSPPPTSPDLKKRKRKNDDESESKPQSKRAAKRKKAKNSNTVAYDEALDVEAGINHAIAHMDSQLLADHVAQRNRRFNSDLSTMELEDMQIPASAIIDSSTWREQRDLDHLPSFLEHFSPYRPNTIALNEAARDKGSPHTLVVTGAGLRAADLTRALRKFQTKEAKVEKLFAKHIKLKEAIDSVKKSRIGIGVGTPQRIADLLEDGALRFKHIRKIVVDASHIDTKKRGILDMRETHVPLMTLLCRKEFKERYSSTEKRLEVLFY
ncbi:hypothetical protein K461DRAFT_284020 [Myriangium duriaei CBS 260.36]|uniref:Protein CMS1 n=1 Tax=Myriangium duriaei CBS 260.36 TaxID=1168546 RepID=A0A9P4MPL9_9PEZI|nr:hypothetical protein K461DRAFT_284020 [Myriangium duriaei CBS 260.36]